MSEMAAAKIRSLICNAEQVNKKGFKVVLQEVKFALEIRVDLFIINKALKNGIMVGNEDIIIQIKVINDIVLTDL
jgi:hypothetical protein